MKKLIVKLSWILPATALLLVASPSAARADETVVAAVPFTFIVGNMRMPAGDYVVTESTDAPDLVTVATRDGRQTAFILTIPSWREEQGGKPQLVFEEFAGQHFLSRVEPGDGDGREILLTPAIMEHELVTTGANAGQ
jgi:predicted 2-oxoglutarate/Fe(II)-dependent dioxygenase YbiX